MLNREYFLSLGIDSSNERDKKLGFVRLRDDVASREVSLYPIISVNCYMM